MLHSFFKHNFFYSICIIALITETCCLLNLPFFSNFLLFIIALVTVLFYNIPFLTHQLQLSNSKGFKQLRFFILPLSFLFLCVIIYYFNKNFHPNISTKLYYFLLINIVSTWVIALCYYNTFFKRNLRNIFWLKPIAVSVSWVFVSVIIPTIIALINHSNIIVSTKKLIAVYAMNFLFILILSIMFDIKDWKEDTKNNCTTIVVLLGINQTIKYLLNPLIAIVLVVYVYLFWVIFHAKVIAIVSIILLFIFTLFIVHYLRNQPKKLFYKTVVDGLIILKAIVGIIACNA